MKKLFSIRKMKKMMLLLFLIPMFLLQAIQSSHFLRVLNEEMAQNGREILSLHQNALDDDISRIANSISSYWALDYSHSKLLYHQSDFNAYQYSYNVLKEYRSLMSLEPSIGALLLISQANHMVLGAYNDSMISYGEKERASRLCPKPDRLLGLRRPPVLGARPNWAAVLSGQAVPQPDSGNPLFYSTGPNASNQSLSSRLP